MQRHHRHYLSTIHIIIYDRVTARTFVLLGKIFCTSNPSELRICCDKHNIPMPVAVVHQRKCIYQCGREISFVVEIEQFTNWICEIFVHPSPTITLIFSKVWGIPRV